MQINPMLLLVFKGLAGLAGALGLMTGALLLAAPRRLLRDTRQLRYWLFEANIIGILNTRRVIEKPIFRHHQVSGTALIAAAALWMWLLYRLDADYHFPPLAQHWLAAPGGHTLVLAGWGLAFFVLVIGLFLLLRPSAMKAFEAAANRWIEPFPFALSATAPRDKGINRLILRAPRRSGMLLLVAGITCVIAARMVGA